MQGRSVHRKWFLGVVSLLGGCLGTLWLAYELGLFTYTVSRAAEGEKEKPQSTVTSEDIIKKNERLTKLEEKLLSKEIELKKRERAITEKSKLISKQLRRYEGVIEKLKAKIKAMSEIKDKEVKEFLKVYSKMEPKKAAKILDGLKINLSSQILQNMSRSVAAEVMGYMSQEKARKITEKISRKRISASK